MWSKALAPNLSFKWLFALLVINMMVSSSSMMPYTFKLSIPTSLFCVISHKNHGCELGCPIYEIMSSREPSSLCQIFEQGLLNVIWTDLFLHLPFPGKYKLQMFYLSFCWENEKRKKNLKFLLTIEVGMVISFHSIILFVPSIVKIK